MAVFTVANCNVSEYSLPVPLFWPRELKSLCQGSPRITRHSWPHLGRGSQHLKETSYPKPLFVGYYWPLPSAILGRIRRRIRKHILKSNFPQHSFQSHIWHIALPFSSWNSPCIKYWKGHTPCVEDYLALIIAWLVHWNIEYN